MNLTKVAKFIENNNLGYILGNAVRSIVYSRNNNSLDEGLQHLKDARQFLNIEIRKISKIQENIALNKIKENKTK